MSDDDYLKTGGVKLDDVRQRAEDKTSAPSEWEKNKTDDLYLKGYGRHFGEKLTYSTGLMYCAGLSAGGAFGVLRGIQQGGATRKLKVNAILNSVGSRAPMLANQSATMTMMYVLSNQFIGWARGADDEYNAVTAGAFAGALYKSTATWPIMGRYGAAGMVFFSAVDYGLRYGKI
jgi:import inner membrane translocase subunit TIM23